MVEKLLTVGLYHRSLTLPGVARIVMRSAVDLFERHHSWVSPALLDKCLLGVLLQPVAPSSSRSEGGAAARRWRRRQPPRSSWSSWQRCERSTGMARRRGEGTDDWFHIMIYVHANTFGAPHSA